MIIQTKPRRIPWTWIVAILAVVAFFSLVELSTNPRPADEEADVEAKLDAELRARHDIEQLAEISRIARAAHQQGMSEAIASIEGSDRGEAFERSCARLWARQQP